MKKILSTILFCYVAIMLHAHTITVFVNSSYWSTNINVLTPGSSIPLSNQLWPIGVTVIPNDVTTSTFFTPYGVQTNSDYFLWFYDTTILGVGVQHGYTVEPTNPSGSWSEIDYWVIAGSTSSLTLILPLLGILAIRRGLRNFNVNTLD